MTRDRLKALVAKAAVEAECSSLVRLAGRGAMLFGAVAACAPALGQLWRLELLAATQTVGHAAAIAGLAASLGGRPR